MSDVCREGLHLFVPGFGFDYCDRCGLGEQEYIDNKHKELKHVTKNRKITCR